MEHAGDGGKFLDDGQAVPVGLPVMDDYRQIQLLRQRQLLAEYHLLEVSGGIFRPVVVQPDLADGRHLRLRQQLPQRRQIGVLKARAVLRVDACGGVHMAVPLCQRRRGAGGGQVTARIQHQLHPGFRQRGQHRVPVAVKAAVVIVGVGIKNRHTGLPRFFFHQYTQNPAV